jgi:hypothetical protein
MNQCALIAMRCHLAISGLVFVWSCFSVFAVMTPRVSSIVESAHITSIPISADFPMPWPDATAFWITSHTSSSGSFSGSGSRRSLRADLLERLALPGARPAGPGARARVPGSPHGNA